MDFNSRILPYYMTYPMPYGQRDEDEVLKDLDYLQQLYPLQAKKYQKRISEIIDKMDYTGSMIYDEYPDRWQLYRLSESILKILQKEAMENEEPDANQKEKWEWVADMIQILMFNEIYRRRHNRKSSFVKF